MAVTSLKNKIKRGNLLVGNDVYYFDSISTVTVGAGGAAFAEFTSIPSIYKHLQIRGIARSTATGSGTESFLFRLNSDTATNYSTHILYGTGSAVGASGSANTSYFSAWDMPRAGEQSNAFGVFIMDLLDYSDSNKFKTSRILCGMDTNANTYGYVDISSGNYRSTNKIDTIRVYPSGGNFAQYSHFALYGVK